jgi:hypothetical protein
MQITHTPLQTATLLVEICITLIETIINNIIHAVNEPKKKAENKHEPPCSSR